MIKTIIFDFDGTIADTLPLIFKIYNEHAEEFGIKKLKRNEAEYLRNFSPKQIIKEFGVSLIKFPFIAAKMRKELNKRLDEVKLFTSIKNTLLKLKEKRFKIGILSSNSVKNIENILRKNDLMIFDFIHSEFNLFGKAGALKKLLKTQNLKADEVIYIGDEVRDIEACKKNNVKMIAVTWGFNKKEILEVYKPNFLISKPRELIDKIT